VPSLESGDSKAAVRDGAAGPPGDPSADDTGPQADGGGRRAEGAGSRAECIGPQADDIGLRAGVGGGEAVEVPTGSLRPADSPRLAGENREHVRALAESTAELPPILVHRATNRVVDGMHRLRAAVLRGEETVRVCYYDGPDAEAFAVGVRANVTHGLPLSLADRRVAAMRIVGSHPQWSDRAIAAVTGLSARTIGTIRWRATDGFPQSRTRIGRDGRTRPLSSAEGRRLACSLLREDPSISLRQVASASGISLSTVRDVRDRLGRGEDPGPRPSGRPHRTCRTRPGGCGPNWPGGPSRRPCCSAGCAGTRRCAAPRWAAR
jgi:hypothetical protein